jgi:DNA-binding transcriptional ArsR family regulator
MPEDSSRLLAALAHPLRRRLIDLLRVDGPATVGTLAERTGQAAGNISHHVRVMAEGGLVEEVPELARDRRERWWRLAFQSLTWSGRDDPTLGETAERINLDHQIDLVRRWSEAGDAERERWGEGPFSTDAWLHLSPTELAAFGAELAELVSRWYRREIPDDGQRREPVFVFARGVPAKP